jgi:hypothetical protein
MSTRLTIDKAVTFFSWRFVVWLLLMLNFFLCKSTTCNVNYYLFDLFDCLIPFICYDDTCLHYIILVYSDLLWLSLVLPLEGSVACPMRWEGEKEGKR